MNKKLMIVIPYFYPKIGGLENYALNIAKGLQKTYKWEIVVVTSNHEDNLYKEETLLGMKIYRLPVSLKLSNTPISPWWYFSLAAIITREKPDIINGHTPVPYIADMAALAAKAANIPFVLTYQNDLEKSSIILSFIVNAYAFVLKAMTLPLSKKIITTTAYFLEKSPVLSAFKDKIVIIPPGVNLSNRRPLQTKNSILFVGSVDKTHGHKGLSYLLEAVSLLKESIIDVKLVVVGKGNGIPKYKKLTHDLGIEENVVFTGFVPDEKLGAYYHKSSVVVLPSTNNSEGFGMVLIEAGAYHKPVIGSKVGGIPYVIEHQKTGLLVKPESSKALSNALEHILTDTRLADRLGENGYQNVVKNYLWEQQVAKTHELLSTL